MLYHSPGSKDPVEPKRIGFYMEDKMTATRKTSKLSPPTAAQLAQRSTHLHAAEQLLQEALKELGLAHNYATNWSDLATINQFREEVGKVLSSDRGEAGFSPWLKTDRAIRS